MDALTTAGLGLDHATLRFGRTTAHWLVVGAELRARVAEMLGTRAVAVEQIGSSSVLGLLAKPIIDLAVGVPADHDPAALTRTLEAAGWIYRGDAGDDGGHVLVLETRPRHRVAHLHVVEHGGVQWRNYLSFRDLLRRSADARGRYEAVKVRLADQHEDDRKAYTDGKTPVVRALLRSLG